MQNKPTLSFVWFGIDGRYGKWKDGLWLAMKRLEKKYTVYYQEPSEELKGDIILFWEAPITRQGKDKDMWFRIYNDPRPKILLFAGGPLKKEWVENFDMVCVESELNRKECEEQGIPCITAFGINEEIMSPVQAVKKYDGMHHGTCASWKRQWLVGEALGDRGLVVGRYQETDSRPFDECRTYGATVMDEQSPEVISLLLNSSVCCLQTSDYWGGGQRCTLEAMSCGIPVVCMDDSPKNMEYVAESGFGAIVYPNKEEIRKAVKQIKENPLEPLIGINYIKSKWTSVHYKDNLIKAIQYVQNKHTDTNN